MAITGFFFLILEEIKVVTPITSELLFTHSAYCVAISVASLRFMVVLQGCRSEVLQGATVTRVYKGISITCCVSAHKSVSVAITTIATTSKRPAIEVISRSRS